MSRKWTQRAIILLFSLLLVFLQASGGKSYAAASAVVADDSGGGGGGGGGGIGDVTCNTLISATCQQTSCGIEVCQYIYECTDGTVIEIQ